MIKLTEKMKEFKNIIGFVIFIVTLTVTIPTYFVLASEFEAFKKETYDYRDYQRLQYLDNYITELQIKYNCFQNECMPPKMSAGLWTEFNKNILKRNRLESKLYPDKKTESNNIVEGE